MKNINKKLIKAAENGDLSRVKKLVEEGANVHAENESPLRKAALNFHLLVMKYLVEQHQCNTKKAFDMFVLVRAHVNHKNEVFKYISDNYEIKPKMEPCFFTYHSPDDSIKIITTPGYFNAMAHRLQKNNKLMLKGKDAGGVYYVNSDNGAIPITLKKLKD